MAFRFDRFYQLNSRILIWAGIVGLIYIMRDFFGLIFMTFLLCSFTLPVISYLDRNSRLPRTAIIIGLYLLILVGLVVFVSRSVPKIYVEAREANAHLAAMTGTVRKAADEITSNAKFLKPFIDPYLGDTEPGIVRRAADEITSNARYLRAFAAVNLGDSQTSRVRSAADEITSNARFLQAFAEPYSGDTDISAIARRVGPLLIQSARITVKAVSTTLLSLLFSFLIVLDLSRLRLELRLFKESRLREIFAESAQPVVDFATVLARALRAQAMIAVCNTVLTLIGFAIIGIPMLTLLGVIVFLFSFIPVLGVFLSTAPAVLLALKGGGLAKATSVVVVVVLIHLVEAYILNPFIYGQQLKLNPVMVLIILFIGHHFFGVWGMLLGVPVSYYFIVYVFGVPIGRLAERLEVRAKPPSDGREAPPS